MYAQNRKIGKQIGSQKTKTTT